MHRANYFISMICLLWACSAFSQANSLQNGNDTIVAVGSQQAYLYQFEPSFTEDQHKKRALLLKKIRALDDLPISPKKREALVMHLYKDINSIKVLKALSKKHPSKDDESN